MDKKPNKIYEKFILMNINKYAIHTAINIPHNLPTFLPVS